MEATTTFNKLRPTDVPMERPRWAYLILIAVTIVVGLASRKYDSLLPPILQKNAGDILWATTAFWIAGVVFRGKATLHNATLCVLFSVGIEFLKFVHTPWLDAVRRIPGAYFVFGHTFSWENIVCYAVGIVLGVGIEAAWMLGSQIVQEE